MKPKGFDELRVGDKVRFKVPYEYATLIGTVTIEGPIWIRVMVSGDDFFYDLSPTQVISKIVKRKKPKLEFVGYGVKSIGPLGAVRFSRLSADIYGDDTHEVWVRPIVRKK